MRNAALNISFKKVVLHGRVKCGGTEGEIVVAHGRLPSPARVIQLQRAIFANTCLENDKFREFIFSFLKLNYWIAKLY